MCIGTLKIINMRKDKRDQERGKCQVDGCCCTEYDLPKEGQDCEFCKHCQAQHVASISEATKRPGADKTDHDHSTGVADSASSCTAPETSHITQTVGTIHKPWQLESIGWIKNPKCNSGKFYKEMFEHMYNSHWKYCPEVKEFRKKFIIERTRLWEINKPLTSIEDNLKSFTYAKNEAFAGPLLQNNYTPRPADLHRVEKLEEILEGYSKRLEKEKEDVNKDNESIFIANTNLIKRGKEYQVAGKSRMLEYCRKLQQEIAKVRLKLDKFKTKLSDIFKNLRSSQKSKRKREIDNKWKTEKRRKLSFASRAVQLFEKLGGEACGDLINPEYGVAQITDLSYETVCDHVSKPYEPVLKLLIEYGCFREEALEIVEQFLEDSALK